MIQYEWECKHTRRKKMIIEKCFATATIIHRANKLGYSSSYFWLEMNQLIQCSQSDGFNCK
jgi:hypothetical protein